MSKRFGDVLKKEGERLKHLVKCKFKDTQFWEGFEILDEKGNLFCIADLRGRQVIIPDINGGLHHYQSPMYVATGMIAPTVTKSSKQLQRSEEIQEAE